MSVFSLVKFITNHPLNRKNKLMALYRFFKWQVNTRLNPYPVIYPFTEKAKLIIQKGMTGATGNLYCGLHEYNDMAFLLHLLRENDHFIDIGANVGSYTVLASAHVGAKTISIEPVPSTFLNLKSNIFINQIQEKVTPLNIALGSGKGTIDFTSSLDTMNHVANEDEEETIKVTIETLDEILINQEIPLLLKIDVEGFETEVIKGAFNTLQNKELKAIIIELNGSGTRYGYDEHKIHDEFVVLGFRLFLYNPISRELSPLNTFGTHNTIYIRDIDFVKNRLITAQKIRILNHDI